jgi:ketosteroid isomerase-like protein
MDHDYMVRFMNDVRSPSKGHGADEENRETLAAIYGAVGRGDFELFGEYLTEDVELDIRGMGPMDGVWRGRKDVVEAARANFANIDEQKPEIEAIVGQGNVTAVLFSEKGVLKPDGRTYKLRAVQWFTFVGGQIKRIDEIVAVG